MAGPSNVDYLYLYKPAQAETPPYAEFSVVELRVGAITFDGRSVPAGSLGTVVSVWDKGAAYDVEFTDPVGIASLGADDLQPA